MFSFFTFSSLKFIESEKEIISFETGAVLVFLGQKNVHYGVDRIVAIHEDGRGWVWQDLNDCGEKAYDGTVIGEECPPRPDSGS